MTTIYALLAGACGLSQREAADTLGVSIVTVKAWSRGHRRPRPGVLAELADLAERIETAAAETLAQIETLAARGGLPDEIELGLARDDAKAQSLGWPCVGAQEACLGRVIARGLRRGWKFRIVPTDGEHQ